MLFSGDRQSIISPLLSVLRRIGECSPPLQAVGVAFCTIVLGRSFESCLSTDSSEENVGPSLDL